jgi:hypothetical protein
MRQIDFELGAQSAEKQLLLYPTVRLHPVSTRHERAVEIFECDHTVHDTGVMILWSHRSIEPLIQSQRDACSSRMSKLESATFFGLVNVCKNSIAFRMPLGKVSAALFETANSRRQTGRPTDDSRAFLFGKLLR